MSAQKLLLCLVGSFCLMDCVSGAINCFVCTGNGDGCATWTADPSTVTCDQCMVAFTYNAAGVRTDVVRGCESNYLNKANGCTYDSGTRTETCRCSTAECNSKQAASIKCHECQWDRNTGDKDFCRTGSGIPSDPSLEQDKCYSCMHTETYDAEGLVRVTRGCGLPDDELACVKNGAEYKCACDTAKCNTQAAETRTCQVCDWYHGRSDTDDCRYGEDSTTQTECFQCGTVETFADDELMRVERGCAQPGDQDAENCDEADNVDIGDEPATIVSSRTCLCKDRDSCNDVSGAGVISSSLAILVSSILIMAL